MMYLQLFFSFLQVGLFSIGGGYAAIPLIQNQVVDKYAWLSLGEFTNLITIAEMTPGPIAVNAATFTGIQILGIPGALVATFGCILPSLILVSILFFVYAKFKNNSAFQNILKALRPVVVALIFGAGLKILRLVGFGENTLAISNLQVFNLLLFLIAFIALRKTRINPILMMCICGVVYTGGTLLLELL